MDALAAARASILIQSKLISVRLPPLSSHEVPSPFGVLSLLGHGDLDGLKRALARNAGAVR